MTGRFTDALSTRCDAFEMYNSDGRSLSVGLENDRIKEIRQGESSGISIRAVKDGKIGFSYSSKAEEDDSVAEAAIRMAPYGKPYTYEFASPAQSKRTRPYDPRCGELDVEQLVGICNRVKEVVKEIDPDAMAHCRIGGGVGKTRVCTSNHQDCHEQESGFQYYVGVQISEEGNFLHTYRYRSANAMIDESEILDAAKEAAQEFVSARKPARLVQGQYPVLFTPEALSDVLRPIAVSVNGNHIEKKTSRWVDSVGQKLFDERLTVFDDPFHEEGPSGGLYDGEGVLTQKRAIIESGVLKGFIHTLSTARQCEHEPTGNACRGVSSQPMPGFHNLVMAAGTDDLDDLMKRAEGGVRIQQMLGTFTSNFLAGQVSGNISLGFLVKEGRCVGRVKNCALNVNTFDLLKSNILGISKERKWVGDELLPYVLVDSVAISARS